MKKRILAFCLFFIMICSIWQTLVLANVVQDAEEDGWGILTTMPVAREFPALAAFEDELYVIGGNGKADVNIYNLATGTWREGSPHPSGTRTYYPDAIVVGEKIYVLNYYSEFYEYDSHTDTWKALAREPSGGNVASQMISVDQKIYMVNNKLTCIYDIELDAWTTIMAPSTIMRYANAAELDGKIYIPFNNNNTMKRLAIYDIETDDWTSDAEMNLAKQSPYLVTFDNRIYAIGGRINERIQLKSKLTPLQMRCQFVV